MEEGYRFRKVKIEDAEEYIRLVQDETILANMSPEFPVTEKEFIEYIKKQNETSGVFNGVMERDGHIVGGISMADAGEDRVKLYGCWVAAAYRGRGLSAKITDRLATNVFENSRKNKAFLQTLSSNRNVKRGLSQIKFYHKSELDEKVKNRKGEEVLLEYYQRERD